MATKKKLLQAAAGSASGAGALNVEDLFSSNPYEGVGSSQVIDNGINLGQSYGSGGVFFPDVSGSYLKTATIPAISGAFTIELWFWSYDTDRAVWLIGKGTNENNFFMKTDYLTTSGSFYVNVAGTSLTYTSMGWDPDGWNHLALVRDASNNIGVFLNGTRKGSLTSISGTLTSETYNIGTIGGGTSPSGGYEPHYGYMSAVRISDTARYDPTQTSYTVPTSNFTSDSNTILLVGQGEDPMVDQSSNSYAIEIVNQTPFETTVGPYDADDAGEGGLVWIKNRGTTDNHLLYDTERGVNFYVKSNSTDAEASVASLSSFNESGFTISGGAGYINTAANNYSSWTWRKARKFFDVVKYTGDGVNPKTISHNLGAVPGMITVKALDNATSNGAWKTYHRLLNGGTNPTDKVIQLNVADEETTSGAVSAFTSTPTSTTFSVGTDLNTSGQEYIAYIWAHNDGDGNFGPDGNLDIIKCGGFAGNGTTFNNINVGFEPQWVMIKNITSGSSNWNTFDTTRGAPTGQNDFYLAANNNLSEGQLEAVSITPTGFIIKNSNAYINGSGRNYIYLAIRRGQTATPTKSQDVFDIQKNFLVDYSSSGFPVDMVLGRSSLQVDNWRNFNRKFGTQFIEANTDTNQTALPAGQVKWDSNTGFYQETDGTPNIWYQWKRAPNFFDVVEYSGNSTNRTIEHSLGQIPKMMWVKRLSAVNNWKTYHYSAGASNSMELNTNVGLESNGNVLWNSTDPTDSVFSLGAASDVNGSGNNYICYLFGELDGISKIGTIAATGVDQTIDCGFTNGARWVLWKQSDGTNNWGVTDVVSGFTSSSTNYFLLSDSNARGTATLIKPHSSGFIFGSAFTNGTNYIFYAIA